MGLTSAISRVRESVVAVLRFRQMRPQITRKGKIRPAEYKVEWGSGFCVVADRFVVTVFHILKNGGGRNPKDKYGVFVVPGNGIQAFHFPVIGIPIERPELDLAVLEIAPSSQPGVQLPALPVSFRAQQDGARVLTIGFPAPTITSLNIDPQGNFRGGDFFLKSHAKEGILSAQYHVDQLLMYEFNLGWHHGESGGPVVCLEEPLAVFTVMQQYRRIQAPHGIMSGPDQGRPLSTMEADLRRLGVSVV